MKPTPLFEAFATFVTEAIPLLGWPRLAACVAALLVASWLTLWLGSLVLCRGEKMIGAALSSALAVVLLAGLVATIALVWTLDHLLTVGAAPASGAGVLFVGIIAAILLFIAVQGGLGTSGWKAAVLMLVLLAGVGGSGAFAAQLYLREETQQLTLLAQQVAGRTDEKPWLVKSPGAMKQIELRQAQHRQPALKARQAALMETYRALSADRAALKTNDHAAVRAFNERAAAYSAEKRTVTEDLRRVEAILAEAEAVLAAEAEAAELEKIKAELGRQKLANP